MDGITTEPIEIAEDNSDPIEKITKSALQRILKRCGVRRIGDVFDLMRKIIKSFLTEVFKNAFIFMESGYRKTIQVEDLTSSLKMLGIHLAAGLTSESKSSLHSCNSVGKSGPVKKSKSDSTRRTNTVLKTNRIINYYQNNSNCLAIPKSNFDFLIRNISHEFGDGVRFSEGVIDLFQLAVEDHIVKICKKAYECALYSNRDTLNQKDIELVLKIIDPPYEV